MVYGVILAQTEFNFICEYLPRTSASSFPRIPIEPNVYKVTNKYGIEINASDVLKYPNYRVKIMFLMVNDQTVFILNKIIQLTNMYGRNSNRNGPEKINET